MKSLTASDRTRLIRLAGELPQGDRTRRAILSGLRKVGMEHASEDALKKYLEDHPKADPKNHTVKKEDSGGGDSSKGSGHADGKPIKPKYRGAVKTPGDDPRVKAEQESAEKKLREMIGDEKADAMIANRKKRDGDASHMTLVTPKESKDIIKKLRDEEGLSRKQAEKKLKSLLEDNPPPSDWKVKGVGKAEKDGNEAYYAAVDWEGGRKLRESLGLDPDANDFHITLGFGDGGDVHGASKKDVIE
jgi:hypothetical protein